MVSNENFNFKVTALFDSRSEKRVYFYLVVVLSEFCKKTEKSIFRVGIQKNGASCTPDHMELGLGN